MCGRFHSGFFDPGEITMTTPTTTAAGKAGKTKRSGGKKAASDRPKMASLFKSMQLDTITLDEAVSLLSLPRTLGVDPADGEVYHVFGNGAWYGNRSSSIKVVHSRASCNEMYR